MGKQIYLTNAELKWLSDQLGHMTEYDMRWKKENGTESMIDQLLNKLVTEGGQ